MESSRGAVWNSNHMHMQNFGFDLSFGYVEIFELFGLDRMRLDLTYSNQNSERVVRLTNIYALKH